MNTKKQRRCDIAAAALGMSFCLLLVGFSWLAVTSIHKEWLAQDYWLAWFSAFSLVGAVGSAILFGVALSSAMDCGTE